MQPLNIDTAPLPDVCRYLREQMLEHFDSRAERERQIFCLAEEAGEFVGAYRRWAGLARRDGSWADVQNELADVLITAHITGLAYGHTVADMAWPGGRDISAHAAILRVFTSVSSAVDAQLDGGAALAFALTNVVTMVRRTAAALDIDLDTVWRAKAREIVERGWRVEPGSLAAAETAAEREWRPVPARRYGGPRAYDGPEDES